MYPPDERGRPRGHDWASHLDVATRLAALKDFDFAGEYDPWRRYPGPIYFVPSDTLNLPAAHALGIRSAHDLFGGVVPYPFVATKAITHPVVEPDAYAPVGWSHEFAQRVREYVHSGFCAFTLKDARRAGARLLENGPVRIKPVRATGGLGQVIASSADELTAALDGIDASELPTYGLVLEENLTDVTTYSVGRVHVADLVATYCGEQRLTRDNSGTLVYGGSDLVVAQGDFEALLGLELSGDIRLAVAEARAYDSAVVDCFPELHASRRNYDVAQGLDANGRRRSGVLEQSWRIGGASSAEVAALEAFRSKPMLRAVRASCVETYRESNAAPADARIHFRGTDGRAGPMTKYTRIERYADAQ